LTQEWLRARQPDREDELDRPDGDARQRDGDDVSRTSTCGPWRRRVVPHRNEVMPVRKTTVLWIVLAIVAILALAGAPAASLALGGGGQQIACGSSGGSSCG
jgi:hypothetical protein